MTRDKSLTIVFFEMPTEQGRTIRILDQTFYVISAGKNPGTVKLFGPFASDGKLSTRTVNWERFLQERIRII